MIKSKEQLAEEYREDKFPFIQNKNDDYMDGINARMGFKDGYDAALANINWEGDTERVGRLYFRKKPIIIEAEQYTEYGKLVKGMCNSQSCFTYINNKPHIHTVHDNQIVNIEIGDYIISEPDSIHYYTCKPDIFEKTYEKLTN